MNFFDSLGVFSIIAVILSIAAVVAAFIFIVPQKKREKLNLAGRIVHDILNFRFLILEKVCQAAYIFLTAFLIIAGFFLLFAAPWSGCYGRRLWLGGYGLLLMILGPIVVRLIFEFLMMALLLVKNVISINNKLRAPGEQSDDTDRFGDNSDLDELRQLIRSRVANRAQKPRSPGRIQRTTPARPRPKNPLRIRHRMWIPTEGAPTAINRPSKGAAKERSNRSFAAPFLLPPIDISASSEYHGSIT